MKNYKIIDKEEVWKALHEDKKIVACILETINKAFVDAFEILSKGFADIAEELRR